MSHFQIRVVGVAGPQGEDLSGGYWEAGGSYLKVAFPQAFAITQLAWAASAFPSGLSSTGLCLPVDQHRHLYIHSIDLEHVSAS